MKNKILIFLTAFAFASGIVSCKKDFLNRYPITGIAPQTFFASPNDLKLYVNKYYGSLGPIPGGWDIGYNWYEAGTDNVAGGNGFSPTFAGTRVVPTNGGWDYTSIRDVNYLFDNYQKATGDQNEIKKYVGEASFFRAWYYFRNLKTYGDIPIVKSVLPAAYDLVKDIPRSPRNKVVDFMLEDLDVAIANLPLKKDAERGRLNKEAALLFKSRIALYEGTWEKYHKNDKFGVSGADGTNYLQIARDASKAIINLGSLAVSGNSISDYRKLFMDPNIGSNKEAILWKDYSTTEGVTTLVQNYGAGANNAGITKALIESYLCTDGKPIKYNGTTVNSLYQGDGTDLYKIKINRDPRLNAIWISPGQSTSVNRVYIVPALDKADEFRDVTGYQIIKGIDTTLARPLVTNVSYPTIIFRYAEVLLNYAEAQAELGQITQADLDLTVNALRRRATENGMRVPDLTLAGLGVTDVNPEYSWGSSPVVNEIRRERRVELALEGFRADDLMRWAIADKIFNNGYRPLGIKYIGSATQNWFIANNAAWNANTVANNGNGQYLNADGYIDPYKGQIPAGYKFNKDRDYLAPISVSEMTLGGYPQNPGW